MRKLGQFADPLNTAIFANPLNHAVSVAGIVIPTTDDFNRSNTTDLGTDWVEVEGDWQISSNQLSVAPGAGECHVRWDHDLTDNHYCRVDILNLNSNVVPGLLCRYNGAGTQTYYMGRYYLDASRWEIYKRVAGTFTLLASNVNPDPVGPYTIAFYAEDNVLSLCEVVDEVPIVRISVADSSIATGAYTGIRATGTTVNTFDNWACGAV